MNLKQKLEVIKILLKKDTHPDMTPQTKRQKMSIARLEGEIYGIMDNELAEARERGDKSAVKRYEQRIANLRKEIKSRT